MSSVAFAVWLASCLISLATTAKPRPACPARAASMVALSASRLVCSATSRMSLTTSPIRLEPADSCRPSSCAECAISAARLTTPRVWPACLLISWIEAPKFFGRVSHGAHVVRRCFGRKRNCAGLGVGFAGDGRKSACRRFHRRSVVDSVVTTEVTAARKSSMMLSTGRSPQRAGPFARPLAFDKLAPLDFAGVQHLECARHFAHFIACRDDGSGVSTSPARELSHRVADAISIAEPAAAGHKGCRRRRRRRCWR